MAADAVFQNIIENTFQINPEIIFVHTLTIGFITLMMTGYLRASVFDFSSEPSPVSVEKDKKTAMKGQVPSVTAHISEDALKEETEKETTVIDRLEAGAKSKEKATAEKAKTDKQEKKKWNWRNFDNSILPQFFTLGMVEMTIVLGLINLLFLAFVIVQIPYLFGGMELVQTTPDFKLAEYARRGFGELVTVSALVLPILLISHWLLRKDKPLNERIFRVLAGIQIGLLFIIMISATQRLLLLTGNVGYGLTTVRFYPMVFMILLALVFIWFGMTVLRGMRKQFAWGTLWLTLFMLGTLHVMNPDDFIVRTNISLMEQGRSFDANYNSSLSDDAIPAITESIDLLNAKQKCEVGWNLKYRSRESINEQDFRSWNYSRWQARVILWSNEQVTDTKGCDPPYRERW
jgi:hypothetical protein